MELCSEKLIYGTQALMMFLKTSKQAKTLKPDLASRILEKCRELLERATQDPQSVADQFNRIVEEMNRSLVTPYPMLITDSQISYLKREIVAFEQFLNQKLQANQITMQQEAPLFNASLHLWEKVGDVLSAEEGTEQLSQLIQKLNGLLPHEEHYPSFEKSTQK